MYAAKSRGRNRFEVFEPTMQTELTARHELHGDLRHALQNGELVVHYQPLLDLETQTHRVVRGARALAASDAADWSRPTSSSPSPRRPGSSSTSVATCCAKRAARRRDGERYRTLSDLCVGVNVSSHQLYDDEFVADVESALHDSGLPPTGLILELTESTLLSDTSLVQERLDALKRLGVRIALDDFGTGYSSLAYLRAFPIDFLKIDRSFVNELSHESDDQGLIMVRSIISIGHNLNLGVVAEGIEQTNQLDELRKAGCNTGQGYLFARPAPPEHITELLTQQRAEQTT